MSIFKVMEAPFTLYDIPLVRVAVPVMAGVALARGWSLPPLFVAAAFLLCLLAAWALPRRGGPYLTAAMLSAGILLYELNPAPPQRGGGGALHEAAAAKMERLGLDDGRQAVVLAMGAGDGALLTRGQRERYARSGTAHLLAVSGLHVGIVFGWVNLLLGWLALVRHGHRLRHLAAVVLIWLYALAAGASPATLRAALMFSGAQAALAFGSVAAGMNLLGGAALVLVVARPALLFTAGFQLSFVSVAAILTWGVPLWRGLRCGVRVVDSLAASFVAGFCAALAAAPIVSCRFGAVSLAGVAVSPLLIVVAGGIVGISALWLAVPWEGWLPVARALLGALAQLQERVAAWAADWPGGVWEVRLTPAQAGVIYLFFVVATAVVFRKKGVSSSSE